MAGLPGSMASLLPAGPDELVRRMRDLERRQDELGPSVARSFAPVIADLAAKQAALDAQQAALAAANVTLTAQGATLTTTVANLATAQATLATTVTNLGTAQADIAAQQAYLASLITKDATAAGFNTGTLIADSTTRYVGTPGTLSIACPTGKLRVIVSCPEASIDCGAGSGAVVAYLSFSIGTAVTVGTWTSRLYTAGTRIGATLTRVKTLTVPPGTYTVSVQAGYWCAGFTAASINFAELDLSVEVVNGS